MDMKAFAGITDFEQVASLLVKRRKNGFDKFLAWYFREGRKTTDFIADNRKPTVGAEAQLQLLLNTTDDYEQMLENFLILVELGLVPDLETLVKNAEQYVHASKLEPNWQEKAIEQFRDKAINKEYKIKGEIGSYRSGNLMLSGVQIHYEKKKRMVIIPLYHDDSTSATHMEIVAEFNEYLLCEDNDSETPATALVNLDTKKVFVFF